MYLLQFQNSVPGVGGEALSPYVMCSMESPTTSTSGSLSSQSRTNLCAESSICHLLCVGRPLGIWVSLAHSTLRQRVRAGPVWGWCICQAPPVQGPPLWGWAPYLLTLNIPFEDSLAISWSTEKKMLWIELSISYGRPESLKRWWTPSTSTLMCSEKLNRSKRITSKRKSNKV